MSTKSIRVRAAAIIKNGEQILVHVVKNKDDSRIWFIPPGGGVHYGESSLDAIRREIKEELGWEFSEAKFIGSFESFHSINGMKEHEISFVYEVSPSVGSHLAFSKQEIEEDNGKKKVFEWVDLATIRTPQALLYPEGLLRRLETKA